LSTRSTWSATVSVVIGGDPFSSFGLLVLSAGLVCWFGLGISV
jgi:hypothetical protein